MRKLLLAIALVAACGGKKDKDKPAADPSHDAAAVAKIGKDAGAPAKSTDGGTTPTATKDGGAAPPAKRVPLVERAQLEALMTAWLEAQNGGDFAAYSALYTDDFKGVRRSGKQTVRLDRAGWLKERKNMFSRPMLVAARDVELTLGPGRATANFTQEWSSGKYHDVGPKVLEVVADGATLKIAREELLLSKIVKAPKKAAIDDTLPPLWPVYGKLVVLSGEIDPSWATGDAELESGAIPERDPACDDDPPDYEEDQDRYWECEASDPDRGHGEFEASQQVDRKALPKAFTALIGQEVRITGEQGKGCQAKIDHLELYAEAETTFSALNGGGTDDAAIAAAVMEGSPVLVAKLAGGCEGDFAQLASVPAAPVWTAQAVSADLEKAARKRMKEAGWDEYDVEGIELEVLSAPDGKHQIVVAWRFGEKCFGLSGLTLVFPLEGKKVGEPVIDESDAGSLAAAVDVDADGWPELVFYDGVAVYRDGSYDRSTMIDFPDEIEEECGE